MGLSISTDETFKYQLKAKKNKALVFRYLSCRENKRMDNLFDESRKSNDADTIIAKAIEGISIGLVGWEGYKNKFSSESVEDELTRADVIELRGNLGGEMTTSELEKKASAFAAQLIMDKSAEQTAKVPV